MEIKGSGIEMEEKSTRASKNIYRLKKHFEFEGRVYEEFTLDFERLTGRDMIAIDEELNFSGKFVFSPETSMSFKTLLISKAAKVSSDVIMNLPLSEFRNIVERAQAFLVGTD